MSGHSHAKTVLHRKQSEDAKRGKIFSKLSRLISLAAKEGPDPEINPKLKQAIEEAKRFNMPKDNVDRAIKKGSGEAGGEQLSEVVFEAYGPGNAAIVIEGITDNKNRALAEIKQILTQYNGKLADTGSVQWLFERKGAIVINSKAEDLDIKNKEDLEMASIEAGAEDIHWQGDILEIYTEPEELEKVKNNLQAKKIQPESASLGWLAKETMDVEQKDRETCDKLFEALDENETVQNIYSNLAR